MKRFYLTFLFFAIVGTSFAQWTTSGSNIYYSSGNVGIGLTTPAAFLHILGTTEELRLGYDASNYSSFTVSTVGALTIAPTGSSPYTFIKGSLITGSASSNLYIANTTGASASANVGYQFAGSTNTYFRTAVGGTGSTSILNTYNYSGLNVASSPITLAASVNVPFAATAVINPLGAVTLNAGSVVSNTATLFIDGASNQGANNYALYSLSGLNYFGGTVGINTNYVPSNYLFAINGNMIASGVTIQLKANWPDYVFARKYHLPSLNSLKEYVNDYKHLPGFPTAAEVNNNGIDLAQINILLTKKVEELTLYLIDNESRVKIEEMRIKSDEDKLRAQDERINKLENEVQLLLKKGN